MIIRNHYSLMNTVVVARAMSWWHFIIDIAKIAYPVLYTYFIIYIIIKLFDYRYKYSLNKIKYRSLYNIMYYELRLVCIYFIIL